MFYKIIRKNTLLPFALLPVLLIGFWAKTFIDNQFLGGYTNDAHMPLFNLVYKLLANHQLLLGIVTIFLVFASIIGINRINAKYNLISTQGVLPGVVFLIFVSGYPIEQGMLDVWFFIPFLVFGIDRLLIATNKRESSVYIFNSLLLVSIGTLFWGKGIYVMPLFWWCMVLLNVFTFRYFLASVIGIILPYFFSWAIFFSIKQTGVFYHDLLENVISPVAYFDHSLFSKIFNGFLFFLILISILYVIRMINTRKILTRKYLRVFIWIVIYGILLAATPFYSMEILPIIGVGVSIVLAYYFESFKSKFWQELVFSVFILLTLYMQWFN